MMQPQSAGRADVHRGTLTYRFHAAEHFDRVGSVVSVHRFAVSALGLREFSLQFFRGHSAPWKIFLDDARAPGSTACWRNDSGTARATLNLLNFLLFSYHLSLFYFTTNGTRFEAGIEPINGGFCCSYGCRFHAPAWVASSHVSQRKPSMRRGFSRAKMQSIHDLVKFIFTARNKSKRDDLPLRQQHERALQHGEFFGDPFDEVSPYKLPRLYLQGVGLPARFESLRARELRKRTQVVLSSLQARIRSCALRRNHYGRVDRLPRRLGRTLESREQHVPFARHSPFLQALGSIHPAIRNLIVKSESGVAVKLRIVVVLNGTARDLDLRLCRRLCLPRENHSQRNHRDHERRSVNDNAHH